LRYVAKRKLALVLVIRLRVLSDASIARVEQSAWEDALETIDLLSVRGASGASRQLVRRLSGAEGGVCRTGSRVRALAPLRRTYSARSSLASHSRSATRNRSAKMVPTTSSSEPSWS
jgi:hypothetical protein